MGTAAPGYCLKSALKKNPRLLPTLDREHADKICRAPSTAVIAATTDTSGIVGITISGTTGTNTTGNAIIAIDGLVSCVFDGAMTGGDYVQISSSTAGNCHDTGSGTYPTSGWQVIGRVTSTNASTGTFTLKMGGGSPADGSGGLSGMTASQVPIAASATTVTSSEPLAGAGAAITIGPASGVTTLDVAEFTGTGGQIANSGTLLSSLAGLGTSNTWTASQTFGNIELNTTITGVAAATNVSIEAGLGTASSGGAVGGLFEKGSDNSDTVSATIAGYHISRCGMLTAATPNAAALEGVCQSVAGYLKGSAVANVGDVVCGTTTAFTVTDCATTPGTNIVGIANATSNPIGVIYAGTALVKLDGALTAIGDNVCMGTTTAGLAHDSSSTTTACTLGTSIGVIIADSGTATQSAGAGTGSTAMSTTLVLVQLHIGQ
jgi:hypothetical protein